MKYLFPLLFNIRSKASGKGKGARKLAEKARGQELHIWSGVEVVMFWGDVLRTRGTPSTLRTRVKRVFTFSKALAAEAMSRVMAVYSGSLLLVAQPSSSRDCSLNRVSSLSSTLTRGCWAPPISRPVRCWCLIQKVRSLSRITASSAIGRLESRRSVQQTLSICYRWTRRSQRL